MKGYRSIQNLDFKWCRIYNKESCVRREEAGKSRQHSEMNRTWTDMRKIIDEKFARFVSVGIVNTVFGTAVMFCLYNLAGCSYWISSAANYVLGSILSYILNRKFTFRHRGSVVRSGIRFTVNIALCYFIAVRDGETGCAVAHGRGAGECQGKCRNGSGHVYIYSTELPGAEVFRVWRQEDGL